jgi:hypothetical protein
MAHFFSPYPEGILETLSMVDLPASGGYRANGQLTKICLESAFSATPWNSLQSYGRLAALVQNIRSDLAYSRDGQGKPSTSKIPK